MKYWRECGGNVAGMWYNKAMLNPNFLITPEINNRVAKIERIREKVNKSRILPQQEIILRLRAKVDSIHSSTSIEGNRLNKREVEKVLGGERVRASEKMIAEALNYKKAIDWAEKRLTKIKEITAGDILKVHGLLMKNILAREKTGRFRQGNIYIVDETKKGEVVRYIGPGGKKVETLIKGLLEWLKNDGEKLHPVLTAGLLHYEFVSIHPFSDGNGRTTRLLTMMYLWLKKYDFRKALAIDTYYWQNRMVYYEALSRGKTYERRMSADVTPWLDFFTEGFLQSTQDLEKEITAVSLTGKNQDMVRLSNDELIMVDFAQQMGRIDLKEVLKIMDLPERTAQRRLKGLVNKKILQRYGKGKNIYYKLVC